MSHRWTFEESVAQLEALHHEPLLATTRTGLRRISYLLEQLGINDVGFRSIHVAGSTGKGSTTTMIAGMLQEAGIRTGCFRSPHLESYRERITVDGQCIPESDWEQCFGTVWPIVEAMRSGQAPEYDLGRPALFEVLFAMMTVYFRRREVEWAAVETGLGGRLDATNTLSPDVAVVTNVSLEHTKVLGTTVEAIAREKAAIIKSGTAAVSAADHPDAIRVLECRAREVGAPFYLLGRDFRWQRAGRDGDRRLLTFDIDNESFTIPMKLGGSFQYDNAATALMAVRLAAQRGAPVSREAMTCALKGASIPGRFEVIAGNPPLILDGAHNPAGCRRLTEALREEFPEDRATVVFAALSDKDVSAMVDALAPIVDRFVATEVPGTDRALSADELAAIMRKRGMDVVKAEDPVVALRVARQGAPDLVLVTGSMYLVGLLRHSLARERIGV